MAFNIANLAFYGVAPVSDTTNHAPDSRLLYKWRYEDTGQTIDANKLDLQATGLPALYERVHGGDVLKIIGSNGNETFAVAYNDNAGNPKISLTTFGEFGIPS